MEMFKTLKHSRQVSRGAHCPFFISMKTEKIISSRFIRVLFISVHADCPASTLVFSPIHEKEPEKIACPTPKKFGC